MKNVNLVGGNINLEGSGQQINVVDKLSGEGQITTNSLDNHGTIGDDKTSNLTVNGTKEVTDAIASGNAELQDLADVVKSNDKSAADSVTSDANDIIGGYSAEVDGNGKVVAKTILRCRKDLWRQCCYSVAVERRCSLELLMRL